MSVQTAAPARAGVRAVREEPVAAALPLFVQPEWQASFPWLVQGITSRDGREPFDLSLFGETAAGTIHGRWTRLRRATGMRCAVHARQVHGPRVLVHAAAALEGLLIMDDADGHATAVPGLLMTVSVADCVPVSLVDPERRVTALLHAGWRGVCAGILENGVATLRETYGAAAGQLLMHLGPAICGSCYEVGPEVHAALGTGRPDAPAPVGLRAVLAARAAGMGVPPSNISVSPYCTRHDDAFHSHRGGARERQMAVLGVRAA